MTSPTITKAEGLFLARVAVKMAETGEAFETAGRAVLADDARIVAELRRVTQDRDRRADLAQMIAAPLYASIRARKGATP